MPKPSVPMTTTKIARFANEELNAFVDDLYTEGAFKATSGDVVGALVLAARRSPMEAVKAVIETYWDRERVEAARGQS
jgi:hypothetical protein